MGNYIETYNNLCAKAKAWSAAYYEQDAPVVTDEEYDKVMHEIRKIEDEHPELITSDSPTQVVGGKRVIGIPVEHRVPMLSLLDVFSDEEVCSFVNSVKTEYPDATFSVERKIDGLSLSLVYERSKSSHSYAHLVQASTRGDGHVGEDVTANVAALSCLPYSIELPEGINKIELRGECYMSEKDFDATNRQGMRRGDFQLREEIAEQIRALKGMKEMAKSYGFDISKPAKNAKEAFQWLYFAYLAAIKTQNGAAMSVGRVSTFLDIYFERDLKKGIITEQEVQELVDHFTMKLRMVKFARIPSYNQLFSGDPVWATLDVAGTGVDGRSMVTKSDFRFLHTLENMGPAPEPNLTVLYSSRLPEAFKDYAARISIDTSSIQYENDDAMKPVWGDDYAICCCVSATQTGKEMQFFGARANLAKCLLYAINGGVDEKTGQQVGPDYKPITSEYLDYDEVMEKYDKMMDWLVDIYVNTLNLIQYMHDKYYYEAAELSLMDTDLKRTFATGIAGFSHVIDSLSAIKYAKVKAIRDENGIAKDFEIEGDFPRYGNDDDRADDIGVWLLQTFMDKLKKHHTYRDSEPTTSILTITSNVVYGKATGAMPDGRKAGEPLSPGANPSYGAEKSGLLASLNSLTKIPYEWALDGISNTQTINPGALGNEEGERIENLVNVMDGYFDQGAHHLNVNVFGKEKLIDAMEHPEKEEYANFTIRVSGYAVKFIDLTKEQQMDVIARTCHDHM